MQPPPPSPTIDTQDIFSTYRRDIDQYSLLTFEEERALTAKVALLRKHERVRASLQLASEDGAEPSDEGTASALGMTEAEYVKVHKECVAAKDSLVAANLRLVVKIARAVYRSTVSATRSTRKDTVGATLLDLIQEGSLGLIRAAESFDPSLGYRFTTYAYRSIWSFCRRAARPENVVVNIPERLRVAVTKLKRFRADYLQQHGHLPSPEAEAAVSPKISLALIRKCEPHLRGAIHLDEPIAGALRASTESSRNLTVLDTLASTSESPEEVVNRDLTRKQVRDAVLAHLKPRDAQIVLVKYGLNGEEPMTSRDIAAMYSISEARVHQIVLSSLEKLRQCAPNLQSCLQ